VTAPGPAAEPDEPVDVRLLNAPLRLWARAEVHNSELLRELALITTGRSHPGATDVPTRLLELVDELSARYAVAVETPDEARAAAVAAGARAADLTYTLPRNAGPALRRLGEMLAEADGYCRDGTLLTLPAASDVAAFQDWYCGELALQLAGGRPSPWPGPLD
jgi:hypothetical protein